MLAKEAGKLDGVIVATPELHQAEITNAFLQKRVAVYCEAPMAMSMDEAKSMVRTAVA